MAGHEGSSVRVISGPRISEKRERSRVPMGEQNAEGKKTTQFADALSFLCSQKRTGKLLISKEGRKGEVFLTEGKIAHAQLDQCVGLKALLFMLAWETGTYNFTPKQTSEQTTIEMETGDVLSLLAKRMREWNRLSADNPFNLNAILSLQPQASGTIRLRKEEWDILARIDGRRSLKDISNEMYMAPLDLFKAIQRFRDAGLIGTGTRYSETACAAFGEDYLSALEGELNLAVGPIAPILVEEALKDLEEATESLIEDKMEILLEKLSAAIPDEEKKLQFLQTARILAVEFSGNEKLSDQDEEQKETEE